MSKLFSSIYKYNMKVFCKHNCKIIESLICSRNKVTIPKHHAVQSFSRVHNVKDNIEIDEKTIQYLERLSLVNLDDPESLNNLKRSIQFATNIVNIDTSNVEPLYTVLEDEPLQMRCDEVKVEHNREDILRLAKCTEEDYYVAPPETMVK